MKRFLLVLLASMLFLANFAFAETTETDFDYKVLSELDGYSYDKFEKRWDYYGAYLKEYSDATVVIGLQAWGDANSVDYVQVYAWIRDEDNKEVYSDVTQLMILADDQLITCKMRILEASSVTFIGADSKEVLRLIGEAKELSFKLSFKTGSITLEPSAEDVAELVAAAKNMYDFNLVTYATKSDLIEWYENEYPVTLE